MRNWRTDHWRCVFPLFYYYKAIILFTLGVTVICSAYAQQELVFKNSKLHSGSAGTDGVVYRFPNVTSGVDALVKIIGRSSPLVTLENLDLTNTGHIKAFQPQVTYNNGTIQGSGNWWMDFQVTFVEENTTLPIVITAFDVTVLDLDGDGNDLTEHVSFYKQQSFIIENPTLLSVASVTDNIAGQSMNGKKFNGPKTNFGNIDTSATKVMATNKYQNTSSFIMRIGAKTTGSTNATDRMYSFWFKSFTYQSPVQSSLPVILKDWSAVLNNNIVSLKWSTTIEQNASHYIVEKSNDGIAFFDVGQIAALGNSTFEQSYFYNDKIATGTKDIIYYRLRMVDQDGKYKTSVIKTVRPGSNNAAKIIAYPNPATNEFSVIIPSHWQGKPVVYQLLNMNGNRINVFSVSHASQTETIKMIGLPVGSYLLKVSQGSETDMQTIIKSRN